MMQNVNVRHYAPAIIAPATIAQLKATTAPRQKLRRIFFSGINSFGEIYSDDNCDECSTDNCSGDNTYGDYCSYDKFSSDNCSSDNCSISGQFNILYYLNNCPFQHPFRVLICTCPNGPDFVTKLCYIYIFFLIVCVNCLCNRPSNNSGIVS